MQSPKGTNANAGNRTSARCRASVAAASSRLAAAHRAAESATSACAFFIAEVTCTRQ